MVSVVIPSYNPNEFVFETIASIRAQTHSDVEIILVNDGTTKPESLAILEKASRLVDRYIEQPNKGLGGARNTGFQAARSEFVVPLDSDDMIRPEYVERCLETMRKQPESAFIYTGVEVFGTQNYIDLALDYNFFLLLERNHLTCCALVRKADWEAAGGYDESMRLGYEDWEFWIRLGARGRYGTRVPEPLFRYRKHGPSLFTIAMRHHDELLAHIHGKHPQLYSYEGLARIKSQWMPSVCIAGPAADQTIVDVDLVEADSAQPLTERSCARAFLIVGPDGADPHSAESAALAVWGGKDTFRLPDGSAAVSRRGAAGVKDAKAVQPALKMAHSAAARGKLRQHFANAELDSGDAWLHHPVRSVLRLIPLRLKERINQAAGKPIFDLSFYLQFQPGYVLLGNAFLEPLRYLPKKPTRRRVALVTPHLGPGGAESVLLEIASSLDRERFELLVLATHSRDDRWLPRWQGVAEHVYDLAALVPKQRMSAAVYSMAINWRCDAVLAQNSLFGYAALPQIRKDAPKTRILDLIHAVDGDWDQVAATAEVSPAIDIRIAISDGVLQRLRRAGVAEERLCLIRNGVDLDRFRPRPRAGDPALPRILFVGRLDPVKRPLLLVDIAEQLTSMRGARDFRFTIAGDGPEAAALRDRVHRQRLDDVFEFLGMVEDAAPLFGEADVLILPSKLEGLPLVVLEAFASGRPVVASKVGAIGEAVDASCGVLVESGEGEAGRFAAALNRILNDASLREQMGAAGRRKVEAEYDRAGMRNAYRRLFE